MGLPVFAIVPENGRREGCSIETFAKGENIYFRKIELSSNSYRFRTYANVYYSDVTLIYDFVKGSEGTKATINACMELSRPYLLLDDTSEKSFEKPVRF